MRNLFKKLIPSGENQELEAIETWIVSWTRRYGEFHNDTEQCYQAFTSKEDAQAMKKALADAHALIGNRGSQTHVSIERQE